MNTETQLYLALKNLYNALDDNEVFHHVPDAAGEVLKLCWQDADVALSQFELELGPLPEWATAHNIEHKPVLWAQLFTLNGRRCGNGLIYHIGNSGESFGVITDMGNTMSLNISDLEQMFEIGDYIMDEQAYLSRWLRNPESQYQEPSPEPE